MPSDRSAPERVVAWWAPGLEVGALLLPPSATGIGFTRLDVTHQVGVTDPVAQRADRVYVTSDRQLAQVFASDWSGNGIDFGRGWLYLVSVDPDELEPDADLVSLPGVSFQCPSARIERVWQRDVKPTPKRSRQHLDELLARHSAAKRRNTQDSTTSDM